MFGMSEVINAVLSMSALAVVAYVFYLLMRWARGRTRGAAVLGDVLTEVTQGPIVYEAKQGKKREEGNTGDPPSKRA